MVSEFTVRVDLADRRLSVVCAACRTALVVDLAEPGLNRLLALFASNHSHGDSTAAAELAQVPLAD